MTERKHDPILVEKAEDAGWLAYKTGGGVEDVVHAVLDAVTNDLVSASTRSRSSVEEWVEKAARETAAWSFASHTSKEEFITAILDTVADDIARAERERVLTEVEREFATWGATACGARVRALVARLRGGEGS